MGAPRGTVDRDNNARGAAILRFDELRWELEKGRLKFPPVRMTREQCEAVESLLPSICERGQWKYLTCAGAPDHVHLIVQSALDPEKIRRLAKRWLGEAMYQSFPRPDKLDGETWWAECGSIRWIGDHEYLQNALSYVTKQRATPLKSIALPLPRRPPEPFDFDLRIDI